MFEWLWLCFQTTMICLLSIVNWRSNKDDNDNDDKKKRKRNTVYVDGVVFPVLLNWSKCMCFLQLNLVPLIIWIYIGCSAFYCFCFFLLMIFSSALTDKWCNPIPDLVLYAMCCVWRLHPFLCCNHRLLIFARGLTLWLSRHLPVFVVERMATSLRCELQCEALRCFILNSFLFWTANTPSMLMFMFMLILIPIPHRLHSEMCLLWFAGTLVGRYTQCNVERKYIFCVAAPLPLWFEHTFIPSFVWTTPPFLGTVFEFVVIN